MLKVCKTPKTQKSGLDTWSQFQDISASQKYEIYKRYEGTGVDFSLE